MLNAAEVINNESLEKNIKKLFVKKNKSKIFLVRIAFHFDELDKTIQIANILKKLGYKLALNLMQISEITEENLAKVSKKINNSKADIFYFADSLGSLNPSKVKIITTIKKDWKKDIGIHAHDNLGKAIQNTVEAINFGATWTDCTVTGMGKGPGKYPNRKFSY